MSKSKPDVSVVMPAYNAEKYISQSINSILNQSHPNFEFIIIDDCSTDETMKIVKHFASLDQRIKIIRNSTNQKLAKSLNIGISLATSPYILRMDADDISLPNRIEKQLLFMDSHPEVGISGGSMEIISEAGEHIGIRRYNLTDSLIRKNIFFYSPFCHPAIIIRSKILDNQPFFDPQFNPAEDYEFYFRFGRNTKFANIPDILIKYRQNPLSMTASKTKLMETQTLKIRRKYINDPVYPNSISAKIVLFAQQKTINIIPTQLKINIFNLLRNE